MPELYEDLARGALLEITSAATVGDYVGTTDEGEGVVSILFASAMPGYPDWNWTVSVAHVPGEEPTVLETELMPGEGALLAPDWVPWSDRLADYKAAQDARDADDSDENDDDSDDDEPGDDEEIDDEDDSDEELEEDDELDEDDVLGNDVLHGGDLDGVDIDSDDDESEFDDDDDDDSDDDDDEGEKTY